MADSDRDTIAAIITPPGEGGGGLGAIRISGPRSFNIIAKIFRPADKNTTPDKPFHLYYGFIVDNKGDVVDEVTTVQMPRGKSYTGQKQVEIFCHGGQFVLKRILGEIYNHNVRPAEPGEFTKRAFLAGRIDLARAEAVADIISSKTEYAYNAAVNNLLGKLSDRVNSIRKKAIELLAEIEASIDYPEEELENDEKTHLSNSIDTIIGQVDELAKSYKAGKIIKEGFRIAIVGRTNAGKSSLFNLLLNQSRAIVAPTPGTTRDYLTEWIDLGGMAVSITDTAGLRSGAGLAEKAGQKSAVKIMKEAHLVVWIVDITRKKWQDELKNDLEDYGADYPILIVLNKIDKDKIFREKATESIPGIDRTIPFSLLSCKSHSGFENFKKKLSLYIDDLLPDQTDGLFVTSERHRKKLTDSLKNLRRVKRGIGENISLELIAFDLRQGINEIDEITGRIYNEEILDQIFARFCIGK
jgi:tRNA modification GTPase